MTRKLVAGVDSSTQSCKIMVRDAATGMLVRSGVARHVSGTEVDPEIWWTAFQEAVKQAGGLEDVSALSVGGQQHGMVCLDETGKVVRPALIWNDTRSAQDAEDLILELGKGSTEVGRKAWAKRTGTVPVASITITKLRWLAQHEPENLRKVAAIALPHDYLTWKLSGSKDITTLTTDRSDASGTGYFDGATNSYCRDILKMAIGDLADTVILPKIISPNGQAARAQIGKRELLLGAGCGDNAGAALGLDIQIGELSLSLGTSGVAALVSTTPTHDASGIVAGFSDATGYFLPLACTLNASKVLDTIEQILQVDHKEFARLALSAPPGAEGIMCIPYFEGERTPDLPLATGSLLGVRGSNFIPSNIARAAIEGMLCGVGAGIRAIEAIGAEVKQVTLIGGASKSEAVKRIAPSVLGVPVVVPEFGEYVADGAARQAAWMLSAQEAVPTWTPRLKSEFTCEHVPFIVERYQEFGLHFAPSDRLRLDVKS